MYNKKKEDSSVTGTHCSDGYNNHQHHHTPTVYHIEKDHKASRRKRMRLRFMFWLFMFILLGLLITVGCCMCNTKSDTDSPAASTLDPTQMPADTDGIFSGLYDY